jgi:hypothetical protein
VSPTPTANGTVGDEKRFFDEKAAGNGVERKVAGGEVLSIVPNGAPSAAPAPSASLTIEPLASPQAPPQTPAKSPAGQMWGKLKGVVPEVVQKEKEQRRKGKQLSLVLGTVFSVLTVGAIAA